MVYYLLSIAAELENLTDLQPHGGCDNPTYPYYFKVKCESCGEISSKETCVMISEEVPLPTGRGTAHLVQKLAGTTFDVDLSSGEFAEYDEKGECPVGIANLRAKFSVVKKHERRGGKDSYV